jgi:hypothetical protein
VSHVLPNQGVDIKTEAALIQGIFGIGGERHGDIHIAVKSVDEILSEDMIQPEYKGKILVGGSLATYEAIKKASDYEINGLVVGGIKGEDVTRFLGYEIGVAITGEEDINLTLIVTEGFGEMNMSDRTFSLLKGFEGKEAAINGATQIRAGVMRPEIIIPLTLDTVSKESDDEHLSGGMKKGTLVRIIADPYFGEIGSVHNLPVQLNRVETGSLVRVVDIQLENNQIVTVPRANVEIIEE